jgi:hypothetical protein
MMSVEACTPRMCRVLQSQDLVMLSMPTLTCMTTMKLWPKERARACAWRAATRMSCHQRVSLTCSGGQNPLTEDGRNL